MATTIRFGGFRKMNMRLYTFSYKDDKIIKRMEEQVVKNYPNVSFVNGPINAEYILAIGGDGTILAAKEIALDYGLPIIGINFGALGFLASAENLDALIKGAVERRRDLVVKRKLVNIVDYPSAAGQPMSTIGRALNDIVISNNKRGKLLNLTAIINGEKVIYSCDSLIISTPVGSTAYNLSAGGSIVHPDVPALILTPVAPFSMSARSIIIPESFWIDIVSEDDLFVKFDGQDDLIIPANEQKGILVRDAVSLVRLDDIFFKSIQDKLKWNMPIKN
jgi:NAD+ kinase